MDATSRSFRRRAVVALMTAVIAGTLLAPITALADEGSERSDGSSTVLGVGIVDDSLGGATSSSADTDTAADTEAAADDAGGETAPTRTYSRPDRPVASDDTGTDDTGTGAGTGTADTGTADTGTADTGTADGTGADGGDDAQAASDATDLCPDLLATATPEGVVGDQLAVAITAQALDTEVAGWTNVAWQPAQDTTLREVVVTGTDGTLTRYTDGTNDATDVASLTFCGTTRTTPDDVEPSPDATDLCPDLLATATPEGVVGDQLAVAITAQALDTEVDGWTNVAWQPAQDTTLREVVVTGTDGTLTRYTDGTNDATDVASLTFCGTTQTTPDDTDAAPGDDTDAAPGDDTDTAPDDGTEARAPVPDSSEPSSSPPRVEVEPVAPSSTSPAPAASTDTGSDGTTSDGSNDTEEESDLPAVVVVEPPETPTAVAPDEEGPAADAGDENADVEEAEVLGVQLTRDDDGSGPIGAGVAMFAAFALIATAGGVLWSRRS